MNTKTRIGIAALVLIAVIAFFFALRTQQAKKASEPVSTVTYSCDGGKSIVASFYEGEGKPSAGPDMPPVPGGSVGLTLSDGRIKSLSQTISADGIRYANSDESFVFWSKGNGALVLENNEEKSYIGCVRVASVPNGESLPKAYSDGSQGFSIRLPEEYAVAQFYTYEALGPGKGISGIKFGVPASATDGTNLSPDSYISIESIPGAKTCSPALFLSQGAAAKTEVEGDTTYEVAKASDAGAGNRYEETVYVFPDTNPCLAIRYFIHYSVFENYPAGSIKNFDETALLDQFDQIRKTLVVNQ